MAERLRPKSLDEYIGQRHLVGPGAVIRRMIESGNIASFILWGPPGVGKTTLARIIAEQTKVPFYTLSAVTSGVKDVRDVLDRCKKDAQSMFTKGRPILFIDEIHRFNKAQQDLLLPDVEDGNVRLIGATTQNPGFYINAPLLSRSHLFRLEPLSSDDILKVLRRALEDTQRGLGNFNCKASDEVLKALAGICDGDMRRALNALETMVLAAGGNSELTEEDVKVFAKERRVRYDADEDEHYNTISAFIKSIRGCDPDAAMYWLAKMLSGGEDPRFIARRLVILASEDVGLADSRGLLVANAAFDAVERVGLPECELNLAHAVIFLATAPKSNSATMALARAKEIVSKEEIRPVPMHLRDSHTSLNRKLGNGQGYIYNHECPNHISGQEYMEKPVCIYKPTNYGNEPLVAERLAFYKKIKKEIQNGQK